MTLPSDFIRKRFEVLYKDLNGRVYGNSLPPFPGVEIDDTARRAGQCILMPDPSAPGGYMPTKFKASKNIADKEALDSTIKHEIAHAAAGFLDGATKHGRGWKRHARKCGTEPSACGDLIDEKVVDERYRYHLVCKDGCGTVARRQRRSKTVKQPERYMCTNCGGDLRSVDKKTGKRIA